VVVDRLLEQGGDLDATLGAFDAAMEDSVRQGYRGFKTVLAYRTGLAVDPDVTLSAAAASLRETGPVKRRAKPLRDLLVRRALGFAAEGNLPVQFHTGFGDSDLRLSDANPLHLERLLRTPEGSAASVVLIHGAFPYHEEAAFLCATRPNIHVDFSLFNLFAPAMVADRLLRLIELAPTAKVLAGSDGHVAPESHWFATVVARDAWQTVRARLVDLGVTAGWLAKAEGAVFAENARELYRL
jgi:predicted TIM-barrel fold metal-dependent hydrolase